jgi:hypothetical protein
MRPLLILFFSILFLGCKSKYNPEEYLNYVSANSEFIKEKVESDFIFRSEYRPSSFMALTELNSYPKELKRQGFEAKKKEFNQSLYFNFSISREDGGQIINEKNLYDYNSLQNLLVSGMNRNFFLLTPDSDTIRTSIYQYDRSNGYSPDLSFLIVFPNKNLDKEKYLDFVYVDKITGIADPVIFRYDTDDLFNINQEITF